MKRFLIAALAACGAWAAYAEDIGVTDVEYKNTVVAPGGTIEVGPNGSSSNNVLTGLVTFENGGTIKALPKSPDGVTQNYHRLWRPYVINGTVRYDASDLKASIIPEFRRSMIATNGTLVVSADRAGLALGSGDPNRTADFPLYDMPNVVFEREGGGQIYFSSEMTLRDMPGSSSSSSGVSLVFNSPRLAIAGSNVVTKLMSGKRLAFADFGSQVVLLDESYVPEDATVVVSAGQSFIIRPSDVVVNDTTNAGDRVVWDPKEGSGTVPFDIELNGGTLQLNSTRSEYEFTGKIYNGGTIDLRGRYTRTIDEIEGSFTFKNTTSAYGTVLFKKVNPGSVLVNGGRVTFAFAEGALPANAVMVTDAGVQYVVVPSQDGKLGPLDITFKALESRLNIGTNLSISAAEIRDLPKLGVTNGANVSVEIDGAKVPTVVGGDGTFTVSSVFPYDLPAAWFDASEPYDTSTKGAPTYAAVASARQDKNFGNIFFTNSYPFIEAWYDVRGNGRTWCFSNERYYQRKSNGDPEYVVYAHVYPYVASSARPGGPAMSYVNCGVNGVTGETTWSKDGPDTPSVQSYSAARRLYMSGKTVEPTAVIMVFGSQQGGGIAMLGGGSFTRAGRTLADPICNAVPSDTTIWLDGQEVDPTAACFNGGWQIVSVVGPAAATVDALGQDKNYLDSGGQNYGEILFFTNTVTDVLRKKVEAYLAAKWGVATYAAAENASGYPLRAEGRTGTVIVASGAEVDLRGTYAGNITVNGSAFISEPLPWTEADVPAEGRVDWYDAEDANSLVLTTKGAYTNVVSRQYPRGKTQDTLTSGYYLWGTGERCPFAVRLARGLGVERTWIDYNHPEGYRTYADDGNVLRFMSWNQAATSGAGSQTFRTLLVALDSRNGGGTIVASGSVSGGSGDFRKRTSSSYLEAIWPSDCTANVKNGVTRLNGVEVDQTKGLSGSPEVLSLTAAANVSAFCVDTYFNTQSSSGAQVSQGTIQGEMLMYDSVLDANVLANLEAYLMGKWTGVLPDGWSDLREATVTAGTGTVSAVAAKLPKFGDGFTGMVAMPDAAFAFTFDGVAGAVDKPFVARGATLDLPAAVAVTVDCVNMQDAKATSVPLFDVAGFANPVAWTFTATNAGGKTLRLREEGGKLMLDLLAGGLTVILR